MTGKKFSVIDSGFMNSLFLRYKFRPVYDLFVRGWIKKILKKLPPIDIAWCFETNIIHDLGVFTGKKIFHVVDPIDKRMVSTGKKADCIICVSDRILQQFEKIKVKKRFVNHALSDSAIDAAGKLKLHGSSSGQRLRAGYVGNLTRKIIDVPVIVNIVQRSPVTDFHFWGPGDIDNSLGGETSVLIQSIRHLPNVFFHPPVASSALIPAISGMDLFLLAYKTIDNLYDSSNSHKLLEYWATGKMVVSTYIDQYRDEENSYLLEMSPEHKNELLPDIFAKVAEDIEKWNSEEMMMKRRAFALSQSYSKNAKTILALLEEEQ